MPTILVSSSPVLLSNQYSGVDSFESVTTFEPFRHDKEGKVIQKIAEGIYEMNDRRKAEANLRLRAILLRKEKGAEDLVLSFTSNGGQTIRDLTIARRAALRKQFRPLGYPCMVEVEADSPDLEGILGGVFSAKYAGIVLINGLEPWELLPVMVTVQDVYTDPQVPNTVEPKLYEIGSPEMAAMMEAMLSAPGVIGARQAGAGFGGCMVALVEVEEVADFEVHVRESYGAATNIEPEIYPVQAVAGAGPVTDS